MRCWTAVSVTTMFASSRRLISASPLVAVRVMCSPVAALRLWRWRRWRRRWPTPPSPPPVTSMTLRSSVVLTTVSMTLRLHVIVTMTTTLRRRTGVMRLVVWSHSQRCGCALMTTALSRPLLWLGKSTRSLTWWSCASASCHAAGALLMMHRERWRRRQPSSSSNSSSGSGVVDVISVVDVAIVSAAGGRRRYRRPFIEPLVHVAFILLPLSSLVLFLTQFLLLARLLLSQLLHFLGDCKQPTSWQLSLSPWQLLPRQVDSTPLHTCRHLSPTSRRTVGRHPLTVDQSLQAIQRWATPIRLARARSACFDWQVTGKNFRQRYLSATNAGDKMSASINSGLALH